jgi:hypothetical protein
VESPESTPRLYIESGPRGGTEFELTPDLACTIGSDSVCDLQLTGPGVAEQHLVIKALKDGGFGAKCLDHPFTLNQRAGLDNLNLKALTKLRLLHLSETQITDVGLAHLKGLTKLEILYLTGTRITDDGLVHLTGLTNLKSLTLDYMGFADRGLRNLRAALPDCEIVD